jgi:hypothetical protein
MNFLQTSMIGVLLASALVPPAAFAATYTTFDVGGATATDAYAINAAGAVTGTYTNSGATPHGYVRDSSGNIIGFDVPGAIGTTPQAINAGGEIAGYYVDAAGSHGFVRDAKGFIVGFDGPNSGGTAATAINLAGTVAGYYSDAAGTHGFVRTYNGAITSFEAPGRHGILPRCEWAVFRVRVLGIDYDGVLCSELLVHVCAGH